MSYAIVFDGIGGVADRPAASAAGNGFRYLAEDIGVAYRSDGTNWTAYSARSQQIYQWDSVAVVAGSDATTTGQSLVDVTGLTVALAVSSTYEFEALLDVATTAVTTGCSYGVHCTVAPTRIQALFNGPTTVASNLQAGIVSGTNADAIASAAFLTTASETGVVWVRGIIVTAAGAGPVLSIQHLKVTSGTSTVKIGSLLKVRKVA